MLDIAFLLRNEKELAPWYAFIGTLDLLIDTFENTADWGLLQVRYALSYENSTSRFHTFICEEYSV